MKKWVTKGSRVQMGEDMPFTFLTILETVGPGRIAP